MWTVYHNNYEVLMRCEAFDLAYLKRVAHDTNHKLHVFDAEETYCYEIYPGGRTIEYSAATGTLKLKLRQMKEARTWQREAIS